MNSEFIRFVKVVARLNTSLIPTTADITPAAAKVELKKRGYTYRAAAPLVGRSYHWICQVLNERAKSQPVLEAIYRLPVREKGVSK